MISKYKISENSRVCVLTGAGISAESGIKTFRDNNGLWENHNVDDVATPQGFMLNPDLVWRFYKQRYYQLSEVKPNSGHYALVDLEKYLGKNFTLITQNVDSLHKKAGSKRTIEMHGTLLKVFCTKCKANYNTSEIDLEPKIPLCPNCHNFLRPDIVWFGEIPYHLDKITCTLLNVDFFITVGTSGTVSPASYLVYTAKQNGSVTIGVNKMKPENYRFIDEFHQGLSGTLLPDLVEYWINS